MPNLVLWSPHFIIVNKATLCQINTRHHVGHFDICTGVGVVDVFLHIAPSSCTDMYEINFIIIIIYMIRWERFLWGKRSQFLVVQRCPINTTVSESHWRFVKITNLQLISHTFMVHCILISWAIIDVNLTCWYQEVWKMYELSIKRSFKNRWNYAATILGEAG